MKTKNIITISMCCLIFSSCTTAIKYHNKKHKNINYDCTEIAYKKYLELKKQNRNVELCIGKRIEISDSRFTSNKISGHTWLYIGNKLFDPTARRYSSYRYYPEFNHNYALKIITKEQEFHKNGFDAYVIYTKSKETKELKPYVIYRKNSKWKRILINNNNNLQGEIK